VAENVIRLVTSYCRPMDERVYAAFSTGPESLAGRRIARWIKDERIQRFTPRDVYRHCWSECPTLLEVQPALEWLAAHRWIREADRQARPGRPSNVFVVNPAIATLEQRSSRT
jgi:hypothetical protein